MSVAILKSAGLSTDRGQQWTTPSQPHWNTTGGCESQGPDHGDR